MTDKPRIAVDSIMEAVRMAQFVPPHSRFRVGSYEVTFGTKAISGKLAKALRDD